MAPARGAATLTSLDQLSAQIGIQPEYRDARGNRRTVDDQVRRDLATAFGLSAANEDEIRQSLSQLDRQKALPLPPVAILCGEALSVPLRAALGTEDIHWTLERENGERLEGRLNFAGLELLASEAASEGTECRRFALPMALEPGYHELHVEAQGWQAKTRIISAPQRCFLPEKLAGGERVWGISVQLYLLRSSENWGI